MTIKVQILGEQQIGKLLEDMAVKLQRNTLRRGLYRAAKVIAEEVSVQAPRDPGKPDLADTPHVSTGAPNGVPTAKVRLKGPHSYLGLFLEHGVAPHLIKSKDGGPMKIGNNVFEGPIQHPGFAPKPFMRPAFDAKADDATKAFGDYLRSQIKDKGYEVAGLEPEDEGE